VPGVALHRHQGHQLHVADAQGEGELAQDRHFLRRRIAFGEHRFDHHVEQRESVIATQARPLAQRVDRRGDIELRLLAGVEALIAILALAASRPMRAMMRSAMAISASETRPSDFATHPAARKSGPT
jgi:hypothetical protein